MTASRRPRLTAGLLLTIVCIAFEGLAVTTAMPVAARDLGGLADYGWAFSAFMLANVVGIVAAGRRTDRHGPLWSFAAGLACFGLGLVGGAVAGSMPALIAARALQGLGGGALGSVVYACVARCYPAADRPRLLAMLSTAWVVPGLVGPGLGGLVADHLSWRLVFLGLVPLVPVAAMLTLPSLRQPPASPDVPRPSGPGTIGWAILLAAGCGLLLLGLEGRGASRSASLVLLGTVIALPALGRLTPPGTLRAAPGLPAAVAAMGCVSVAFFGAEILLPLLLTVALDQPATVAGLALSAATLAWTTGAWVQARAAPRRSRRMLVGVGATFIVCGIAVTAAVPLAADPLAVAALGWATAGLGMGIAHTTISLTVVEQAPSGGEGAASASMQLANALGVALGAGGGSALVGLGAARGWPPTAGFAAGFGVTAAAALATLALARRLPGRPPAGH